MEKVNPTPVYVTMKRLVDAIEQSSKRNVNGISATVQGNVALEVRQLQSEMYSDVEYYELSTEEAGLLFVLGASGFEESASWILG